MIQKSTTYLGVSSHEFANKHTPSFYSCSNFAIAEDLSQLGHREQNDNAEFLVIALQSTSCIPRADLRLLKKELGEAVGSSIKHLILVSSALIYGAQHSNPGRMLETQRLPQTPDETSSTWKQAEELADDFANSNGLKVTILRTSTIVDQAKKNPIPISKGSVCLTVAGRDPSLQLLSRKELSTCIGKVMNNPEAGVFNLAPSDAVSVRNVLKEIKRWRMAIPAWLLALMRIDRQHLKYCWSVCTDKFANTFGYSPKTTSLQALLELTELNEGKSIIGQVSNDPFGLDKSYVEKCGKGRFRFCEKIYWRIEHQGIENIPESGGAILAGTHRGFMPFDGVMMVHLLEQQIARVPRFLIHPSLVKFGHLDGFLKRIGGIIANQDNANWVLENEELLGIFPEGIRGAFKEYDKDIYTLGNFGRNDFVKMAIRHQVPIVPFVTLGPAESFPILHKFNWRWWKKLTGWPCLPITLTWPFLPLPLPTKWHFQILEPIHPLEFGAESVEDRNGVKALSDEVRARMQAALDEAKNNRKSHFRGSVLNPHLIGS